MKEHLLTISRILGRCIIFTLVIILIWFAIFQIAGDAVCNLHGRLFGVSLHECGVLIYGAMGFLKIIALAFFFFPWLAIQLELRRLRRI